MAKLPAELVMEIEKLAASSPKQRLIDGEHGQGFRIVSPGEAPWLPASDWHPMTLCSTDGMRVRLVALAALDPGHGAMRRLVTAITAAGLEPVMVAPSQQMAKTLHRWGWRSRRTGRGFTAQEVWYPRRVMR